MKASGGIDDHVVGPACLCRLQGVKEHRCGVATRLVLDDFDTGSVAPDLKLFDSRCAEGVGRGEQHCLTLCPQGMGEFTYRRRLACAVHAYDQYHLRLAV